MHSSPLPTALPFQRATLLAQLREQPAWDVVVIGGGATGLGVALDALSRGFRTLLLEQYDFAKGTSSRSTKLVHGGVRYLAQGQVGLVREALHERGLLLENAPHLVHNQSFIIPTYKWWARPFYGLGLKAYDVLAGSRSLGRSELLGAAATRAQLGNVQPAGLRGGVLYHDGQFDDARLAVNLAQTAVEAGGTLLNYVAVTGFLKTSTGQLAGVRATDQETGETFEVRARCVVNATGVFVDEVRHLDEPAAAPLVQVSQGVHVVVDRRFLPGDAALLIPQTDDGRVLFAVPWHGAVVLGTTDTPRPAASAEPRALAEEVEFILRTAARYLHQAPTRADVRSVWAGLRPLAAPDKAAGATHEISRRHHLQVSAAGLLTITGGKWTTYRRMGADVLDRAIALGQLPPAPSRTAHQPIHGAQPSPDRSTHRSVYGTDQPHLLQLQQQEPALAAPLHPNWPHLAAEVIWAARYELARTVEDVLARRLRVLFLDARAAQHMAPTVAALLAAELGHDLTWQQQQVEEFTTLAQGYLLPEAES